MTRLFAALMVVLALHARAGAADPASSTGEPDPASRDLDAVREQLVALEIEKALAALAVILERPTLSEPARLAALDLRAQAHAAGDELDAVEKDYRSILELQPGYAPNPEVTSKKAMDRFAKTRAAMIGTVRLDLDPNDASVSADGRPVVPSAERSFPALAGDLKLSFARKGFDPQDATAHVVAGDETSLKIRLVPNARTLVVRTDLVGVTVTMDGVARGMTVRPPQEGSPADAPAALVLEDAPVGEHEVVLSKSCFATETIQQAVSVDLADRSPKVLPVVAMRPARTRVTATGAQYDGELRVDGERVAPLPATSFSLCPGSRSLEVIASGRVVWSGTIAAEETDITIDLTPRPSAVLVGAAWPKSWEDALSRWSLRERIEAPAGVDLAVRAGWSGLSLPPGTDLAVGVIPSPDVAGNDRTVIYGTLLEEIEDRGSPPSSARPMWIAGSIGAVAVDGEAGAVVIAQVAPEGPAAKAGLLPGDRLIAIGGRPVTSAEAAGEAILRLPLDAAVPLDIASPSQPPRRIECKPDPAPLISPPRGDEGSHAVRAAWASVDAAAGRDAPIALANLAVLLESAGKHVAALDVWRRVRETAGGRLGARASYAVGVGLQETGKRVEAIAAFNQARAAGSTLEEPVLAAAAVDRLADLGVAPR